MFKCWGDCDLATNKINGNDNGFDTDQIKSVLIYHLMTCARALETESFQNVAMSLIKGNHQFL